jgi:hypothetical protein
MAGRRVLPARHLLLRGAGLGLLAWGLGRGGLWLLRKGPLGVLMAAPALGAGMLAAWGAAIQLTGGERLDDHHWE